MLAVYRIKYIQKCSQIILRVNLSYKLQYSAITELGLHYKLQQNLPIASDKKQLFE